jgi:hypothetical protein
MRTVWRLGALALLLDKCHGSAATVAQIHVLNWAIRSSEGRSTFLRVYHGEGDSSDVIQRFDPTLDRAIDFAVGLGLSEWTSTARLRLTGVGSRFVREMQRHEVLGQEKAFLGAIQGKFSQARLDVMSQSRL